MDLGLRPGASAERFEIFDDPTEFTGDLRILDLRLKAFTKKLFKSSSGQTYSADLNGSLNILRKVVGDSIFDRNSLFEAHS
ncbi:MAG: hypothetical protein ACR9NN_05710 [Nostochopsis sp.]